MYESWFELDCRPFSSAPQVDRYFPSKSAEAARRGLTGCIERGVGPALLVGPAGCGKTALLHVLIDQMRTRFSSVVAVGSGLRSRRALLQSIQHALGRPYRNLEENELRLSLQEFLGSTASSPHGMLLVIDDAHTLTDSVLDELQSLSELAVDGRWVAQVVLAGKMNLEEKLATTQMESFNQRIGARCFVEPFDGQETKKYVYHQLRIAGQHSQTIFQEDALRQIYATTGGVPRLINQVCDHALVLAATGEKSHLCEYGIREAWADLQQLPPPESPPLFPPLYPHHAPADPQHVLENDSVAEQATFVSTANGTGNRENSLPLVEFGALLETDAMPYNIPSEDISLASETSSDTSDTYTGDPYTNETGSIDPTCDEQQLWEIEHVIDTVGTELRREVERGEARGSSGNKETCETAGGDPTSNGTPPKFEIVIGKSLATTSRPSSESRTQIGKHGSENPFAECFVEEELVIDRCGSIRNRVVSSQPRVTGVEGRELALLLQQMEADSVTQAWKRESPPVSWQPLHLANSASALTPEPSSPVDSIGDRVANEIVGLVEVESDTDWVGPFVAIHLGATQLRPMERDPASELTLSAWPAPSVSEKDAWQSNMALSSQIEVSSPAEFPESTSLIGRDPTEERSDEEASGEDACREDVPGVVAFTPPPKKPPAAPSPRKFGQLFTRLTGT